jgi:hypothetical protein
LAAQNDALITRANNIAASLRHKASR